MIEIIAIGLAFISVFICGVVIGVLLERINFWGE